jgi:hypothetical protein
LSNSRQTTVAEGIIDPDQSELHAAAFDCCMHPDGRADIEVATVIAAL